MAKRSQFTEGGALLCVDAPAVLYRAFFALPKSIRGVDGQPVNALLGSINAILRATIDYRPRRTVICFGAEAATYRKVAFPSYHASRPEMPDELADQWAVAAAIYRAFDWLVLDSPEYEADDLLHSLALSEAEQGGSCLILTGDRDLFQSVTASVGVLLQAGKGSLVEVDLDEVARRYGVAPDQVADFIALRGDPSDEIPGAKGIGAKTAADLLQRHRTLEAALRSAIRERPAIRRALLGQPDELLMFRRLAQLQRLELAPPDSLTTNWEQGATVAAELGLTRLAARLRELAVTSE